MTTRAISEEAAREARAAGHPGVSASARSGTIGRRGLSWTDRLTLLAIGVLVVLVSLPRLRRFALRENEIDAIRALSLLAGDALESREALQQGGLPALLAASTRHQTRLEDVEILEGGRLRRHGYLLDVIEVAPGDWRLRAWPWNYGQTGLGAFIVAPGGAVMGDANREGLFSGPECPPGDAAIARRASWVEMPGSRATP